MLDPAMSQHQSGPNRRERTNPAWTLNSLVRAVGVLASLIGLGFQNRLGVEIPLVRPRRAVEGTQTMAQIKARTPGIAVSRSRSTVTDWHSTALAAAFGVVRNSQELLTDP